jgi:serine/threonine-protein kinase RsbW
MAEGEVHAVGLCVNEALANVIRHAYNGALGRPIEVTARWASDGLVITIRDWGNGEIPPPPRRRDPLEPGGLGLICLKELMDESIFQPQPDGMLLTLVKRKSKS